MTDVMMMMASLKRVKVKFSHARCGLTRVSPELPFGLVSAFSNYTTYNLDDDMCGDD
jgi:hypothetical protein